MGKVQVKAAANMDFFTDYERKRDAAGLSDSAVCESAGVANSTISRARRAGATMGADTHKRLCTAINTIATQRVQKMRRAGIRIAIIHR